jgi:ankyrin repeat protein
MRENPDIDQLKRQAKELLSAFTTGQADAVTEVNAHYRNVDANKFALHDAQLVLARAYGFDSWPKLKAFVDGVTSSRLYDAAERGDVEGARELLRRRPELVNMDTPAHGDFRALHLAVQHRDAAMVQLLMENGADTRHGIWPHREHTTPTRIAIEHGFDDIVAIIKKEELRRSNAKSTEVPDDSALRKLEQALGSGNQSAIITLLETSPALIDYRHPDGWTLLHCAAGMLYEQVVAWLLARGADVDARAKEDWTPLEYAASGNEWRDDDPTAFPAVAKLLLKAGARLSSISAVALGELDWVRAAHANGSLINATNLNLWGPFKGLLSTSLRHNQTEMFTLLLDLGLDPDEKVLLTGGDETIYSSALPLHICAGSRRYEEARMLLERGANPNAQVYAAGSPVGNAYGRRDWEMVKLLESFGGVVYAAAAGYFRDADLARRLLALEDAGQLPEGIADQGKTLVETLFEGGASGGEPEIVKMVLERVDWPRDDNRWYWRLWDSLGFWNHFPWQPAVNRQLDRSTYLECFRMILERCDPNALRSERLGQSILHEVAAMRPHVTTKETVQFATVLLDAGARLDVRDNLFKSTPLGWACRWGRVDLVKLLLERGADPIEADAEAWARPKAWAEKMGHSEIVALLDR